MGERAGSSKLEGGAQDQVLPHWGLRSFLQVCWWGCLPWALNSEIPLRGWIWPCCIDSSKYTHIYFSGWLWNSRGSLQPRRIHSQLQVLRKKTPWRPSQNFSSVPVTPCVSPWWWWVGQQGSLEEKDMKASQAERHRTVTRHSTRSPEGLSSVVLAVTFPLVLKSQYSVFL